MKDPIWKKTDHNNQADPAIMAFLAGEDVELDRHLLLFDIKASAAHVSGLQQINILSEEEAGQLKRGLQQLQDEVAAGTRELDNSYEDGHSAIESWLTEMLGEVGAKIHTGRSRNDQVAVALRLYMKDRLSNLQQICIDTASVLLKRIETEAMLPMAGYTHLQ